ncbi:hypothetical protein B0J17DRAFT_707459 [Rhizoctonia solani]|nr:hypothetical protein B0J17DRAFT_707459 [Rhizoctonia solani]
MLLTRVAPALTLVLAFHAPQAGASPINVNVTARAYYSQDSSSNSNGGVIIAIVAVAAVGMVVGCVVLYRQHKRREQERESGAAQQTGNENTRRATASRTPVRRTTINYIGIAERTGNPRVETWGADTRIRNVSARSTHQTRENRRPTQNSTPSLPAYNEQAPSGEVVLLERVQSTSDDGGGRIGNETENTPTTGAVPPYAVSNPTPEIPHGIMTTTESPRERRTKSEHIDARVPAVGMPGVIANIATSSNWNVPSYGEATVTATSLTTGATEAVNALARGEEK